MHSAPKLLRKAVISHKRLQEMMIIIIIVLFSIGSNSYPVTNQT